MDKIRRKNGQKVVVAMSGGLDSSVAAALLKRAGVDVIGAFMKFWSEPQSGSDPLIRADSSADLRGYENRCCSLEAEVRARKVARILKIPFYVFNFKKEFKKRIVDYFLNSYQKGLTPNPCVVCNKEIKFGLFLEKALKIDADFIATGHYAKKQKTENRKQKIEYKLLRAKDKEKDQSYFLWQINQKQLKRVLFPIGDYTRNEVENLAKKFKLPVLKAKKSVEICFIQTNINDFLARHLKQKPGQILCSNLKFEHSSKIIGKHQGLAFYTIGQRKGIELSGGPFYVVEKNLKENTLIVTSFFRDKTLYSKSLIAKNVNWIFGREPSLPIKVKAQIRYRHKSVSATIIHKTPDAKYKILFAQPQRAITPGQSIVFFKGREVLGGGIIC